MADNNRKRDNIRYLSFYRLGYANIKTQSNAQIANFMTWIMIWRGVEVPK